MIQRRLLLQLGGASAAGFSASYLAGCGGADSPSAVNRFTQANLVANQASYRATFTEADFVNAWGIAIRPQGAGGHFWVGAGGTSWEYVGDVQASSTASYRTFFQDGLKK
ncbi:hypothetical protein LP416_01360 [Polaromonas sp. P2-4]|nr:hypothetical protein LP416_01360 [Polaromonas sp. P2-4]